MRSSSTGRETWIRMRSKAGARSSLINANKANPRSKSYRTSGPLSPHASESSRPQQPSACWQVPHLPSRPSAERYRYHRCQVVRLQLADYQTYRLTRRLEPSRPSPRFFFAGNLNGWKIATILFQDPNSLEAKATSWKKELTVAGLCLENTADSEHNELHYATLMQQAGMLRRRL